MSCNKTTISVCIIVCLGFLIISIGLRQQQKKEQRKRKMQMQI